MVFLNATLAGFWPSGLAREFVLFRLYPTTAASGSFLGDDLEVFDGLGDFVGLGVGDGDFEPVLARLEVGRDGQEGSQEEIASPVAGEVGDGHGRLIVDEGPVDGVDLDLEGEFRFESAVVSGDAEEVFDVAVDADPGFDAGGEDGWFDGVVIAVAVDAAAEGDGGDFQIGALGQEVFEEIGRASCRESV